MTKRWTLLLAAVLFVALLLAGINLVARLGILGDMSSLLLILGAASCLAGLLLGLWRSQSKEESSAGMTAFPREHKVPTPDLESERTALSERIRAARAAEEADASQAFDIAALAPPVQDARQAWTPVIATATHFETVTILFATDREPSGSTHPNEYFGAKRRESLSYGACDVTIPAHRRIGQLPRPTLWRLEFSENPMKHVMLAKIAVWHPDQFFAAIATRPFPGAPLHYSDALVFVHGFNVSFAEAARRAALLTLDLQFPGISILYSWPSCGRVLDYVADTTAAEHTQHLLEGFLADLVTRGSVRTIHLMAHSMGARPLARAMMALAHLHRFSETIFAAPDDDTATFKARFVTPISACSRRVTLYASATDRALTISSRLNRGARLGQAGRDILVTRGIETVDASNVDGSVLGHSYVSDIRPIVNDVRLVIAGETPDGVARALRRMQSGGLPFWQLPA